MIPSWLNEQTLLVFLLVLTRLSGMMISAPFFTQIGVPAQVKIAIALTLSLILFPLYGLHVTVEANNLWTFSWLMTQELVIGLLIGFAANLLFAAVNMAGTHIATQMGLNTASMIDPVSQEQIPVIGQLYFILAITLFMHLNIHHQLILAVAKSFEAIPVASVHGAFPDLGLLTGRLMMMAQNLFKFSIILILPAFGILLVQEVALAFVSKLMPQMNIFMVALPLKVGIALVLMYLTLPYCLEVLTQAFDELSRQVTALYQR